MPEMGKVLAYSRKKKEAGVAGAKQMRRRGWRSHEGHVF